MVSACARRLQVGYAHTRGISIRRACQLLSVVRSTLHYQSRLIAKDAPALRCMRRLSAQYPRFGYRRIHVFLDCEGQPMSPDRAYRLWRLAGLQVPSRRPRRRVAALARPRPLAPRGAGEMWAYDFVFDACANGQQLKCLTVIDEYTRECLAIDVASSMRSQRVIEVLARLITVHGAPKYLRSDNGPEFVSRAILKWLRDENIQTALIDPGKPWQNGMNESFNDMFRDGCLSMEWFRNRLDAKIVIESWRRHFNEVRPHSSLKNLTPAQFKEKLSQHSSNNAVF
jgi:putative transposase